jgi:replicative DNA helicase
MDERLSGALQENLLTLLCFDDKHCKIARAALTPQLFESSVYKEVAGIAIDFIDQYGEAVKEHLPDHLEGILKGEDARKAASYKKLVDNLFLARDSINGEYCISQLNKFVRAQTFKAGLVQAVEALENGDDIDTAELVMSKAMGKQVMSFHAGINMSNTVQMQQVLDTGLEEPGFTLGIKETDRLGIYPRRKQLTMLIAARGRGKSFFITHCAKMALVQRWKPLIITLEMSEIAYTRRMLQSFFSISKDEAKTRIAQLQHGKDGSLTDIIHEEVERRTLKDEGINEYLMSRIRRDFRRRPPFYIKSFPTKSLTMKGLEAYLDQLERFENFVPDVIFLDYPDLMKHDVRNKRLELGEIIEQFRGLCDERNAAGVVVSQGNRDAEKAPTVTGDMVAEDISKLATVDTCFTYSSTPMEAQLGLGRILVEKARDARDGMSVLLTQAYGIGQFCLDSTILHSDYWDVLGQKDGGDRRRHRPDDEDGDDDDQPRTRTRRRGRG